MKETKYSRVLIKRTDVVGLSATTAPSSDHTLLPAWSDSDIYVGELFLNATDEKLWIRTTNSIMEIPLLSDSSSLNAFPDVLISNPQDGQLLTYSGGTWVNKTPSTSSGDTIVYSMMGPMMMGARALSVPMSPEEENSPQQIVIEKETIVTNLDELSQISDVHFNNLHDFDVLIRREDKWVNMPALNLPKKIVLGQIDDINIDNIQNDQMLYYQDGKWINKDAIDKVNGLVWDRQESKLQIDTNSGTFELLVQGKPIQVISESIELDNTQYSIIIDAKRVPITIILPSCQENYGHIFKFKIINHTHQIKIIPSENDFIFVESLSSEFLITEDNFLNIITLQSDGEGIWYSM